MKRCLVILTALILVVCGCAKTTQGPQATPEPIEQTSAAVEDVCPYTELTFQESMGPVRVIKNEEIINSVWQTLALSSRETSDEQGDLGLMIEPFSFELSEPGHLKVSVYLNIIEVTEMGFVTKYAADEAVREIEMRLMEYPQTLPAGYAQRIFECEDIVITKAADSPNAQETDVYVGYDDVSAIRYVISLDGWSLAQEAPSTADVWRYAVRANTTMELRLLPEKNLAFLSYSGLGSWYTVQSAQMEAICSELEKLI